MPSVNLKLYVKVLTDFILLIIVALPVLIFYLVGVPYQRGFFCDDESIRYPFKPSTVTSGALYAFGTIIPVVAIILVEYFRVREANITTASREKLIKWFWSLYRFIGVFLFGCAVSHLTVDCRSGTDVYVTEDVCTPDTPEDYNLLRESRLSFISGHASFSTYTMFYLIFYLQYRFCKCSFSLIRPVIQYACFGLAVFTTLSRVSDYKHHWSDVLAGFVNGAVFAVFCAFWVAKVHLLKFSYKDQDDIQMCNLGASQNRRQEP
ncbi:Phospholipid phosphatase 3 [Armadillidium nasatum]|uniref:Phospholipid phosphatase 3 n=1 Tax=Armadillidium nasatum TaxID=96803 RepID=A0A5N5SLT4_9CRUS|nr:Phospholipid phosphatase 3 [Armadillidium nasatum]